QPWTEHPDADENALSAPLNLSEDRVNELKHIDGLKNAQAFVQLLVDHPEKVMPAAAPRTRSQLERIAQLSIYNKKAILNLTEMGDAHEYVHAGFDSALNKLLPGVKVSVLGPPNLEQSQEIRSQTHWDEDQFWKLYARGAHSSSTNITSKKGKSRLFPNAKTYAIDRTPPYIKWVIEKLDKAQAYNVQRIVRTLDRALNNTSVILLFEIGDKALLFPGDAQLESWEYVFSNEYWKERLENVSLYKVGHHGSTNATPKFLWNGFKNRAPSYSTLLSLLSTEKDHHSKIPRGSLVKALKSETKLEISQSWRKLKEEYVVFEE
ncbi:MAG: hypothetical protein GY757_14810, partial [bacterium]|nr:hypothetical protein [bacterium]